MMNVVTAVSSATDAGSAAEQLAKQVADELRPRRPDLCVLFATAHYEEGIEQIAWYIAQQLTPRGLIGMTAEAVIHDDTEYEHEPAVTLWAAALPGARVATFHLSAKDLEHAGSPEQLREQIGVVEDDRPSFLLLCEPFTFDAGALLDQLAAAYPGRPAIGGMASAGDQPGQNRLVFDGQVMKGGAVGAALSGPFVMETVVSQGCRPIGRHLVITKADQNIIYELSGKRAYDALAEMLSQCPVSDLELARSRGLLIGRVINEQQGSFTRGDFLIRNPLGIEPSSRAMAVNDVVRIGQTVQFHVRDAASAAEDLDTLLAQAAQPPARGGLLFTCNGRGTRLFSERHHDARAVARGCGKIPLAGCFCAGEIGPVGQRNFVHGHTASLAFFRAS